MAAGVARQDAATTFVFLLRCQVLFWETKPGRRPSSPTKRHSFRVPCSHPKQISRPLSDSYRRENASRSLGCLRECVEGFLARVVATLDHLGAAITDADNDEFFIEFQNVEFFFSHRCFHLKVEMPTFP